ncbi:sensor histidine kinase [Phytohabitans rumicis]|uniref:Signal transduction histidine-protein kinase/phosphatase MprB n=1 Tax=Phytohabitans rumicis TaxID=1076125 RepID=A0A6V8KZH0_9ACTN|nr:HAMP domain-containing sensor histidine kinase [Phytohabitans rumicis]GFJ88118.1 two-component sensor histidine kinase [Phytohabitans rumicis]
MIPLGLEQRADARDEAIAEAQRRSATVAGALTVASGNDVVRRAVQAAGPGGQAPVVHGMDAATDGAKATPEDVAEAASGTKSVVNDVDGGVVYLQPVRLQSATAVIEVFVPAGDLGGANWWLLIGLTLGLVIASVIVVDRLASVAVGSARSLVQAAMAVGDGDLAVRVQPSGPRELAEAGFAFNRMADKLVTSRSNERELVADLSHRLRTPLTVLRLDADALDSDDTSVGQFSAAELDRRRTIRRIRQAIVTLEGEVDVLIKTSRKVVEQAAEPEESVCDASEVVRDRMVFWSALASDQQRPNQVLGAHTRIPVPLPRAELAAALDAVLGNVFRYTPQGAAFEVAISRRDGYVALRVDDAGPGIANPDRALARGMSDRGSTGLGLDIARRAAQQARGSVSIDRAQLGGASVIMLLADAEATPRTVSRFGLVGRLAREPGSRRWPRQRSNP